MEVSICVLDLCTVYCVLCTVYCVLDLLVATVAGRRAFRPRRRVVLNLCTVYCVLDLAVVVGRRAFRPRRRVRRPRRRVAARCVLDLCTVYCVLDLAVFVLSPVRCVRAYSTVCRAVLQVGATRRPATCDASTSYVRRVGQVDRVSRRTTGRCDASTS
jgi:hypothetical protein